MFDATELAVIRRAFARQVMFLGGVANPALEKAFARVPREAYLGPGPWKIMRWPNGYLPTPDADPAWLYSNVLVGILPERGLNNGEPSAHATWIAAAAPSPGDHVVHVGAGVGYYSAIMGEMSGPEGALTAIEFDQGLAERAAKNLGDLPHAVVVHGDGASVAFAPADVIYVNAGASRPADAWLDGLKDGGRLLLPLTTSSNFSSRDMPATGAVFRVTRRKDEFDADYIGPVGIFPCAGLRNDNDNSALVEAFRRGGVEQVKRLRRDGEIADQDCWLKAPGWSLTYH